MNDLLDRLVEEQPVLDKSPLTEVICQVRFQEILGLSQAEVRPIQKAFADEYPLVEREEGQELSLSPFGLQPTGRTKTTFRFRDVEKAWTVTLGPEMMSLDTTAYLNFKDFASRWIRIIEKVVAELEIPTQDRLGLRYVNQLACPAEPSPENLRQLVRPELVGIVGAEARTSRLLSSLQEARFLQDDGTCTLRHGLVEEDEGKTYVLDFDYYDEERKPMDLEAQLRSLVAFNHGVYELFSSAVTEETLKSFEPKERSDG
jgi:uncharacterized protein (TIGR04255 family)